ncbi:hypothetical protein ABZZ47_40965 [Streptomyces sp. NPDC006465]|uniref:hypothetical protein n=1 Tax=Streptomyces sp. NPDC006465 TaxID=3157174 RepID=UPI0033A4579C
MHIASVTRHVTAEWVTQQARNVLISLDDMRTVGIRYLIRDNAGYFTEAFDAVFTVLSARVVPILPGTPRMNAITERAGSDPADAKPPTASSSPENAACVSSSTSTPTTTTNTGCTDHSDNGAPTVGRPTLPPPISNRVPSGATHPQIRACRIR